MNFSAGLSLFANLVLKNLGSVFGAILIYQYENRRYKLQQPGYYDFSAVTFSSYIIHVLGMEFLQLEWS